MEFRLLGPFDVWRDGAPVALGGRRQRAVLALLVMHAGEVVSTDRIVEEIWAGDPPPSAVRTLHSYVSRLRSVLADETGRDLLVRRDPGYVLDVDRWCVDVARFERLVGDGLAALERDDPGTAEGELRAALGMWRGDALADFAYEHFAEAESRRLEERRLEALELRIDADLMLGRHAQLVAELEALVAVHPLRERFWAQLMMACYRSGRQSDALAAYSRIRGILIEELGIEPGDELRLLERQVLEQSADLTSPGVAPGLRRSGAPVVHLDHGTTRRVPLPERLLIRPDTGVIGRDEPVGLLVRAAARAGAGEGRSILLVSGEAGQGKSTVVAEAARLAFADGACVLSGHCEEDVTSPYQLVVEAIGHYLRHLSDVEMADLVGDQAAELSTVLPEVGRRLGGLRPPAAVEPDTERYRLFAAVVDLVGRMCLDRPLVLVLDDLQWADQGSLQLLRHLAASDLPMRLTVMATYRDAESTGSDSLVETLGAFRRMEGVERIDLPGFGPDEVVSVMEAIAGQSMDDRGVALADAVHGETDGNPFFVGELLRHLFEVGVVRREEDGRWVVPDDLSGAGAPDGVREVIDARVVRLGRASAANLSLAAVLGRDFDLDLLLAVADTTPDDLLDVLEEAARVSLVREPADMPGWYSFSHALIQRTLYEGIGASRRALLHRKVFDVLSQWDERGSGGRSAVAGAELARHLVASARPEDAGTVVRFARRAADEALAALQPDQAVRWFGVALDALGGDDDDVRARLLAGMGEAQRQTGDLAYRQTLLEAARLALVAGDTDTLVDAALANSRQIQSTTGSIDQERVDVLEASLDRVGPADTPVRARLLAHLASDRSYDGDPDRRRGLVDEALAIARRTGDPATLFDVLIRRIGIWMPEHVGIRLEESAEALAIAEALDDPVARFWALFYRSIVAAEAADRDLLDECARRFPAEARATGQPMLQWSTTYAQSWLAAMAGDLEESERLTHEALELGGATGQPDAMSIYGGQLVDLRWHQGRDAELVELIEGMVAATPEIDSFPAALARIYVDVGRVEDARALLATATEQGFPHPFDPLATTTIALWSEAAIQAGDTAAARVLVERLASFADQVVCSGVNLFGSLDHYRGALLGVLGDHDGAEGLLRRALEAHQRLGAPFFEARTSLELARVLRRRGDEADHSDVLKLAGRSVELADRFGYATVARRARELADA